MIIFYFKTNITVQTFKTVLLMFEFQVKRKEKGNAISSITPVIMKCCELNIVIFKDNYIV